MNVPEAFELFKIPDGKEKVECSLDERTLHTATFTILLEDHTLGNIVKMMLLRNPKVRFAAYRKPHPLENKIEIRIQTNGEITPTNALNEALVNLCQDLDDCYREFEEELKNFMQ